MQNNKLFNTSAHFWLPLTFLLSAFTCVLAMWYASIYSLNCDSAVSLDIAERILKGEKLYKDLIMSNTPFVFYYSMVPVLLSHFTGITIPNCFLLFCFSIFTFCTLFSFYLFSNYPGYRQPLRLCLLAILVPLLIFFYCCFNITINFGQREHFFFALFLPYVALTLNRLRNLPAPTTTISLITGLCALLGSLLKPHFFLIFAAGELYVLLHFRSWRSSLRLETILVIVGTLIAYGMLFFYTDYFLLIPQIKFLYAAQWVTVWEFLQFIFPQYYFYGLVGLLIVPLLGHAKHPHLAEIYYLCMLIAGGFLSFLLHRTGYPYQALPMLGFFYCLFIHVTFNFNLAVTNKNILIATALASATLLLPSQLVLNTSHIYHYYHKKKAVNKNLYSRLANKTVALFGTSLYPAYPFINYIGMHDVLDTVFMWVFPAFYLEQRNNAKQQTSVMTHYHAPESMPAWEKHFFNRVVTMMVVKQPDILIVDISPKKQDLGNLQFDFLTYFKQDKRFASAFAHYQQIDSPIKELAFYQKAASTGVKQLSHALPKHDDKK